MILTKKISRTKSLSFAWIALWIAPLLPQCVLASPQQELSKIKQSLVQQQKTVDKQQKERSVLLNELESQEKSIAKVSQTLKSTRSEYDQLSKEMAGITANIKKLSAQETEQRQTLADQLQSAFKLGRSSGLDLLFEHEQSERNERIIQYFAYINQARQKVVKALEKTQLELKENRSRLERKVQQQKKVVAKTQDEQKKLSNHKKEREKVLVSLSASLKKNQQRLEELKRNQKALQDRIAKAEREARARAEREAREAAQIRSKQRNKDYQPTQAEMSLMARVGGLGRPANQYAWPVKGQVLHTFGSALQGELFWKGMVIAAPEGTPVKSIAAGRVILASWLQGYGFVVVIEHGKNDMSLYGYNQRVNVKVNDNVKAGQTVALIGDSGGQNRSALYFEIRRNGQALNPQPWLTKKWQ